ncbi:antibiotic biosynthesis monooxygenase family protein [Actinomadura rupiterrae]|uniref:antibiotic biosynthesis monooxygenase family protein n=1 Tax=Actinomadura rupiterrae TaxID=559627 RepID=UPI0020A57494|nr:antibiotic biosynthesis monooxygenase family protein [Actinomadura rupiterrae]MCP2343195.1 heme-degrading monooxygenase HmoA [Actinomadura rupiterrae]
MHDAHQDDGVTFINVIEIPTEQVEAFVEGWRRRADLMSAMPGFRGYRLHRALSGESRFQLVNVSYWDSAEAFRAATANPRFQEGIRALEADARLQVTAHPALYQVVVSDDLD